MIRIMARKSYSDEFRRQAVDLYESTPGATLKGIAADLGITRGTLAEWVRALGAGTTASSRPIVAPAAGGGRGESPAVRIARLQARVAELEAALMDIRQHYTSDQSAFAGFVARAALSTPTEEPKI